ncbi:Presenilin-domain-containing protein [Haematococcus lacustris]
MQDERKRSVLDTLGEEVTGIVAPVSLCMLITVILVRILNPDGSSSASGSSIIIASVAYNENPNDSASTKFSGALLNAVIFAGIMAAMTFVLVALFYYKCYKIIYGYMTFAVFDIFFLITGVVALQVLQAWNIHVDVFSFLFSLLNFSVCGTLGLLFMPMPLLAKQGYNIWTGVVTAYIFTWIPEWTSWLLICIMALYDIAAVLIPGGPLNLLVRLSQERQQGLPALVYEARPTHGRYQPDVWARRGQPVQEATQQLPLPHEASQQQQPGQQQRQQQQGEEEFEMDIPDSIKLGLGDFIFYSMLVGRAAMYDYMTVFSSYLGIIAGLGITLLCLTFYQKALPALPFSIALGVAFYFLTRLVLEPFLVPLASSLTYF